MDQTGVVMNTSVDAGELFPNFGPEQDDEAAKQYVGVGNSILEEIDAIMGDCMCDPSLKITSPQSCCVVAIFKCPSYYLLDAFHQKNFNAFKVSAFCMAAYVSDWLFFTRRIWYVIAYVPWLRNI